MGRLHRERRGRRDDRGSVTVEMAAYTAAMLLALTVCVQAAVWALANLAAQTAANHALQATRVHDATAADGHTDAQTILAGLDPRGLTDVTITVTRDQTTTTVTITGQALSLFPGIALPVQATAQGPTEEPQNTS